jgi:hypothetical protein
MLYFITGVNTVGASMRNAPVESEYLVAGLKEAGAVIIGEPEFALLAHRDKRVAPTDKVVGFFNTSENAKLLFSAVHPRNRWTYVIDTKVNPDGTGAYAGRIAYCQEHSISHAVVTYVGARDLQQLALAGISYLGMPHCSPEPRVRRQKVAHLLFTGAVHDTVYPTRARLSKVLGPPMPCAAPRTTGKPVGEEYYEMIEGYNLGIVDRSGIRDYMVAKYVEFGACHVLPVGDCPSYMPIEMQQAMVNVEGMSDDEVKSEVARLLSRPEELMNRQDAYTAATHKRFDRRTHSRRVVQSILST